VALGISAQVIRLHLEDGSLIYVTRRDVAGCDQIAQPLGSVLVNLVVIGAHRVLSHNPIRSAASAQFSAITALAQSSPGRVSASAQALYACQEPDACFVRETRVMHRRRMSASVNY